MSYQLPETCSLETMLDYAVGVEAGLAVEGEGLEDLAPDWAAIILVIKATRDGRDDRRHALIRSIAVLRARDRRWDNTIGKVSSRSYEAANKKADQAPYAPLFGSLKANAAKQLGPAKAVVFGSTLAKRLDVLAHPELAGLADDVRAANQALEAAYAVRQAAYEESLLQAIPRSRVLVDLHMLIAHTEAKILTRFPGEDDRVRALLSPYSTEGSKKNEEGVEEA